MNIHPKIAVPAFMLCGVLVLPLAAAEEPAATPYRPTVSNPAALPAPGYFEFEFGVLNVKGGEARRRNSVPVLMKYAFTENFGLLIGGDKRVSLTNHDEEKLRGESDATLQLKFRHQIDDDSALGLEAGVKVDTAKTGVGSGRTDYLLNGIYSREINDYTLDVNLGYTHFGVTDASSKSRHGMAWAASCQGPGHRVRTVGHGAALRARLQPAHG